MIEPFKNPGLTRATPLRIEGDTIYGHFCAWGTQHTARPGVTPPRDCDYRYFHLGAYKLGAQEIDCGKITLHTCHAGIRMTADDAIDHYENTGSVCAYVKAGNDAHGAWCCGKLATGLEDEDVEALRGATLSGDWRGYNGKRELIGILAVNVPGFPIERERVLVAAGRSDDTLALVASGVLPADPPSAGERLRLRMLRKRLAAAAQRSAPRV